MGNLNVEWTIHVHVDQAFGDRNKLRDHTHERAYRDKPQPMQHLSVSKTLTSSDFYNCLFFCLCNCYM